MKPKPEFDFDVNPEQRERLKKLFGWSKDTKFADFKIRPEEQKDLAKKLHDKLKKKNK